ncbi:cobalt ECF transporter T component CbiQ [Janibacter terrae]|uniref:Cobalt ECF transporter T component CbiQ n=1 Tax=Janibacter terrae TaxID=103817 RepID=A0ABZ2FAW5_9MICO|nr:cobalt ECF transporter T component CbiQ [Janibacter terrae]MBA4084983.1 cobalt ECF transporter T component CbiQ [Kytococcus sp.]
MGGPHGHALSHHGHSPAHRAPAHLKILATFLFVVLVVATPREAFWAFGAHALVLLTVLVVTRVPVRHLAPRLLVEVPFLLFAALMPFVATGPRVEVGPLTLSEAGLWGAWTLLAKATLGVGASLLLAATTEPADIVSGLARLRLPSQLVMILGFMVRYTEVVTAQLRSMRVARESRGFRGGGLRSWPVLAGTAGALFIRSYERGERVHLAMLARGHDGRVHAGPTAPVAPRVLTATMSVPLAAAVIALSARMLG